MQQGATNTMEAIARYAGQAGKRKSDCSWGKKFATVDAYIEKGISPIEAAQLLDLGPGTVMKAHAQRQKSLGYENQR